MAPPTIPKRRQDLKSRNRNRNRNQNRELQIVGPIISATTSMAVWSPSSEHFKLPDGWVVEERPRRSSNVVDKYYYEPGTGRQFRSLLSVKRYLSEEITAAPPKRVKSGGERKVSSGGGTMQIIPWTCKSGSTLNLPDGWVTEEIPRRANINYAGKIDKYYIEPGTGKRFRSLISAVRYLEEVKAKEYTVASKSVQKYQSKDINVPQTTKRVRPADENNMQIVPWSGSAGNFSDGWVVKKKPRSSRYYEGTIDKCYNKPRTGKRFRSLISIERSLKEGKAYTDTPESSKPGDQVSKNKLADDSHSLQIIVKRAANGEQNHTIPKALKPTSESSGSQKLISGKEVVSSMPDPSGPPSKIKWILSPGGNIWSPFINDSPVPEYTKRKWSEAFVLILNDRL